MAALPRTLMISLFAWSVYKAGVPLSKPMIMKHLLHRVVKEVRAQGSSDGRGLRHGANPRGFAHWVTAMARPAGQCANRMPRPRTGPRIQAWRTLRPRKGRLLAALTPPSLLADVGQVVRLDNWQPSMRPAPQPRSRDLAFGEPF